METLNMSKIHTIYKTCQYDEERTDYARNYLAEERDIFPSEVTDDDIMDFINNEDEYTFDDELDEARIMDEEHRPDILAVANLGLWNGRKTGYRELGSMEDVMYVGNHDYIHIYVEGDELKKSSTHHDGTNHMVFREWKSGLSYQSKLSVMDAIYNGRPEAGKLVDKYTMPMGHYWAELYGWRD